MSIGETLSRARREAGLSIVEVSRRTRIRLSVVDDIEHDDFSACGGNYRARGAIAAIAQTVGVDAGPLIEAYDAARLPGSGWIAPTETSERMLAAQADEEPTPGPAPESSEPMLAAQAEESTPGPEPEPLEAEPLEAEPLEAEPLEADEDTEPIAVGPIPEPILAGEPVRPFTIGESPWPVRPADTAIRAGAFGSLRLPYFGRRPGIWVVLGGALLAAAVLGGILLVVGAGGQPTRHAGVAGRHHGGGVTHPGRTPPPGHSARPHGRTGPKPARNRPARLLAPASIAAFGPDGTGHGDSPQLARQALADKAAAPWHSAWYTTPRFGDLQTGTGLLLDMGRPVTITSARISLGNHPGTDLVLRIGNSPTLASLPPAAHANGAGGVVRLRTTPTRGRYVLVWFTRLPPDQAGTFQVSVYDITVSGHL